MAQDYYFRQGWRAPPYAYQDAPCRAGISGPNGGCYYNSGYGNGSYWATVLFLRAGIPGSWEAGGGPTGASQATNRPRASNEKY